MKRLINILFLALMPLLSLAQDVEMADTMRSNGKIYVVVGVIAIIFVGLLVYMVMLDRRLAKLEKEEK
jgi:CcmD family protein